jgi:hypothetical protein
VSPREINLLLRITGWADEKLQAGSAYTMSATAAGDCYDDGHTAALEELLEYISELKAEVK